LKVRKKSPTPQEVAPKRKIGQGALQAAWRQGLRELAHALRPLPTSIPIIEEPGQIGTATTQAVSQQTGVSQPVRFDRTVSAQTIKAENVQMNMSMEPQETEPVVEAPQTQSVVDELIAQAEQQMQVETPDLENPQLEIGS
jgi:hypothetical protein